MADALVLLVVCVSAVTVSFQAAWSDDLDSFPRETDSLRAVDLTCDGIFVADILINFFSGYERDGIVIRDLRMIAEHCNRRRPRTHRRITAQPQPGVSHVRVPLWTDVRSSFLVDLISSFPVSLLPDQVGSLAFVRLARLSKLLRLAKLSVYSKDFAVKANLNPGVLRMCICFAGTVIVCHWAGCMWFAVYYNELRFLDGDHAQPRPNRSTATATQLLAYPFDQIQGPPGDVPPLTSWVYAFYWGSAVITGFVPFGIEPNGEGDTLFTTTILFVGLVVQAVIISALTSAVTSIDSTRQFAKDKLDRVHQHLRFQGVDPALRLRIDGFYRHLFSGVSSHTSVFGDIPAQLSTLLQIETYRDLILNCHLFRLLDNRALLLMLRELQPCFFLPGQVIIHEGAAADAMYFVIHGIVQVRLQAKESELVILSDSDFFGESALVQKGKKASADVAAVTYCSAVALTHARFERVMRLSGSASSQVCLPHERRHSCYVHPGSSQPARTSALCQACLLDGVKRAALISRTCGAMKKAHAPAATPGTAPQPRKGESLAMGGRGLREVTPSRHAPRAAEAMARRGSRGVGLSRWAGMRLANVRPQGTRVHARGPSDRRVAPNDEQDGGGGKAGVAAGTIEGGRTRTEMDEPGQKEAVRAAERETASGSAGAGGGGVTQAEASRHDLHSPAAESLPALPSAESPISASHQGRSPQPVASHRTLASGGALTQLELCGPSMGAAAELTPIDEAEVAADDPGARGIDMLGMPAASYRCPHMWCRCAPAHQSRHLHALRSKITWYCLPIQVHARGVGGGGLRGRTRPHLARGLAAHAPRTPPLHCLRSGRWL